MALRIVRLPGYWALPPNGNLAKNTGGGSPGGGGGGDRSSSSSSSACITCLIICT